MCQFIIARSRMAGISEPRMIRDLEVKTASKIEGTRFVMRTRQDFPKNRQESTSQKGSIESETSQARRMVPRLICVWASRVSEHESFSAMKRSKKQASVGTVHGRTKEKKANHTSSCARNSPFSP